MPSTNSLAQEAISVDIELEDIIKDKPDKPTSNETNPTPEDSAPPVERVAIDVPPRPSLSGLSRHLKEPCPRITTGEPTNSGGITTGTSGAVTTATKGATALTPYHQCS